LAYVAKTLDIDVKTMKTAYYIGNALTLLAIIINVLTDFESVTHRHVVAITGFSMIINFFVFAMYYALVISDYVYLCLWFNVSVAIITLIIIFKAKKYGFLNFKYDKT
jgi:hypothetical protein